jgi:hypothetical protein
MPNINDYFPSAYLKAADIHGHEPVVTIDRVEHEPVGRQKEMKAVLYFRGKDKGLILNKTNANKIIEMSGSALTEEWDGFRVRLYVTETQFGGDTVDCIRIKSANGTATRGRMTKPAPAPAKPVPAPVPVTGIDEYAAVPDDDEIPF